VHGLAAAAQEVGRCWLVGKSGAFCQECAAFVFAGARWTWHFARQQSKKESTKKNRPNFRWSGFSYSLIISRRHRISRRHCVRMNSLRPLSW
jgi:hypothetical protein